LDCGDHSQLLNEGFVVLPGQMEAVPEARFRRRELRAFEVGGGGIRGTLLPGERLASPAFESCEQSQRSEGGFAAGYVAEAILRLRFPQFSSSPA